VDIDKKYPPGGLSGPQRCTPDPVAGKPEPNRHARSPLR